MAPHLAPWAGQLAERHDCEVIVGVGPGWVDSIADAETPNRRVKLPPVEREGSQVSVLLVSSWASPPPPVRKR